MKAYITFPIWKGYVVSFSIRKKTKRKRQHKKRGDSDLSFYKHYFISITFNLWKLSVLY